MHGLAGAVKEVLTLYGRLQVLRLNEAIVRHCDIHMHILRKAGRRSTHRPPSEHRRLRPRGRAFFD